MMMMDRIIATAPHHQFAPCDPSPPRCLEEEEEESVGRE